MAGGYQFCPDCNRETETEVDGIRGESICTECGLVVDANNVDETQDVRIFEDNQGAQRIEHAGPAGKDGLAATIIVGSGSSTLVRTARKSMKSSKESTVREYREAMSEMGIKLRVSQLVVDRALYIFDSFSNSSGTPFRGKDKKKMDAILVSCLYNAGKQLSQQKPLEELAQATGLKTKDIFQAGKTIQPFVPGDDAYYLPRPEANLRSENDGTGVCENTRLWNADSLSKSSQGLKSYVSRLCRLLGFEFRERMIAEEMATEVVKSMSLRRKPGSTAGVIVWICSLLHGRETDLSLLSKNSVSVKILRQTYAELYPHLKSLVPTSTFGDFKDWVNKLRSP